MKYIYNCLIVVMGFCRIFVYVCDHGSSNLKQVSEKEIDHWNLIGSSPAEDSDRRRALRQRLRLREENKLYPPRLGLVVQHLSHAKSASEEGQVLRTLVTVEGVEPLVEAELHSGASLTVHSDAGIYIYVH